MSVRTYNFGGDAYNMPGMDIGEHRIHAWPGEHIIYDVGNSHISMPCVRVALGAVSVDVYYADDGKGVHVQITGPNAEEDPFNGCTSVMLNDADLYEPEDKVEP